MHAFSKSGAWAETYLVDNGIVRKCNGDTAVIRNATSESLIAGH
jgi:hypothetical protein